MLATFALIYTTSCSKDDEPTPSPLNNENPVKNPDNTDSGNSNQPPTAQAQKFEVAEDAVAGDVIGVVEAEDLEGNPLTYTLVEDASELFQVAENGEITLAEGKSLDFETTFGYSLTLHVSDGVNEPVEFTVNIKVVNVIEDLFEDPESFILKFEVTAGQALTIGTSASNDYDFTIDWGDGTIEEGITDQNPTHQYQTDGTYSVAIKGIFPAIRMGGIPDTASRAALLDVVQWGTNKWKTFNAAFFGCNNLEGFSATTTPNLLEVTDVSFMFYNAQKFNEDIGEWDVSNITSMSSMFSGATAFNQSLAVWNIGNVSVMSNMLNNSGMSAENLNATLIGWNNFVETNDVPKKITLGVDNLTACGQEVITAIQNLEANHEWTFDGNLTIEANCQ